MNFNILIKYILSNMIILNIRSLVSKIFNFLLFFTNKQKIKVCIKETLMHIFFNKKLRESNLNKQKSSSNLLEMLVLDII